MRQVLCQQVTTPNAIHAALVRRVLVGSCLRQARDTTNINLSGPDDSVEVSTKLLLQNSFLCASELCTSVVVTLEQLTLVMRR